MIQLPVDECYAFDYLSILSVKATLQSGSFKEVFEFCYESLRLQLGDCSMDRIMHSKEYQSCYDANLQVFIAVDKAKRDEVKASFVDECNYKRYLAKLALQNKFFGTDVVEKKIGYE